MNDLSKLKSILEHQSFSDKILIEDKFNELTLHVPSDMWFSVCTLLKNNHDLKFEVCIDLCVVDYLTWGSDSYSIELNNDTIDNDKNNRFAVVVHLLSISNNWRLRVKTWLKDIESPVIASLVDCWPSVNWFEREAFDLFGIIFDGHNDLRRILTDYGFIGHPMRKDFPLSGKVEIIYDEKSHKTKYQPVSIDPREVTPRIIK